MYTPWQFIHYLPAALQNPGVTAGSLYCLLIPVFLKINGNRVSVNRLNSWEAITYTPPANTLTIFRLGKNRFVLPAVPAGKVYQTDKAGLLHPPGTAIFYLLKTMQG